MKKWEEPKVLNLFLENTKNNECPSGQQFEAGVQTASPGPIFCTKKKSNGEKAYTPKWGIYGAPCIYYGGCFVCNYQETVDPS